MNQRAKRIVAGVLVVGFSIGSLLSAKSTIDQRELARTQRELVACQARWDDANNDRSRRLAPPLDAEREATRKVFRTSGELLAAIAAGESDPDAATAAFLASLTAYREWEAATDAADRARAENPLQAPVSQVCRVTAAG